MVNHLPGKEFHTRILDFFFICDCSGSMSINGKIQSLNNAIREAIPHIRIAADQNERAKVRVRAIKFSHSAAWHIEEPIDINLFHWDDLVADPIVRLKTEIVILMDTSGSMNNEITSVKTSCENFAQKIIDKGGDVKLGLVGFGIGGFTGKKTDTFSFRELSRYTIGIWPLDEPRFFHEKIQDLKLRMFGGAGCYIADTDTIDVFKNIVRLYSKEPSEQVFKILLIVSDEMGDLSGLDPITKLLNENRIQAHVLGLRAKYSPGPHELIASKTGGKFWDLKENKGKQDFSILLSEVAGEIAQEVTKVTKGGVSKGTDMGKALELLASELIESKMPARGLCPVIMLISDGVPTDNYKLGLRKLLALPWGSKAVRLAISIGKDANLEVLRNFVSNPDIPVFQANNPDSLSHYIKFASTTAINMVRDPRISITQVQAKPTLTSNIGDY